MDFKTRYADGFETDLLKAIDWYYAISEKNARAFVADVETTIQTLSKTPMLFQKLTGKVRKANLAVYPYKIFFKVTKTELLIIAIVHHKRHPRYWKGRK